MYMLCLKESVDQWVKFSQSISDFFALCILVYINFFALLVFSYKLYRRLLKTCFSVGVLKCHFTQVLFCWFCFVWVCGTEEKKGWTMSSECGDFSRIRLGNPLENTVCASWTRFDLQILISTVKKLNGSPSPTHPDLILWAGVMFLPGGDFHFELFSRPSWFREVGKGQDPKQNKRNLKQKKEQTDLHKQNRTIKIFFIFLLTDLN